MARILDSITPFPLCPEMDGFQPQPFVAMILPDIINRNLVSNTGWSHYYTLPMTALNIPLLHHNLTNISKGIRIISHKNQPNTHSITQTISHELFHGQNLIFNYTIPTLPRNGRLSATAIFLSWYHANSMQEDSSAVIIGSNITGYPMQQCNIEQNWTLLTWWIVQYSEQESEWFNFHHDKWVWKNLIRLISIPPYLFISENTVMVQPLAENCYGQPK